MECSNCQAKNAQDAKFCNMCGEKLEAPVVLTPEETESLLAEGYSAIQNDKPSEALYIAETVLKADPKNTSALALKALVHEQREDLETALSLYEQILSLKPDSTLDRIRLIQIHKQLEAKAPLESIEQKSQRSLALLAGAGACLTVIVLGVVLALATSKSSSVPNTEKERYASNLPLGFEIPVQQKTPQPQNQQTQNPPSYGAQQNDPSASRQPNPFPSRIWNPGPLSITRDAELQPLPDPSSGSSNPNLMNQTPSVSPSVISSGNQNTNQNIVTETPKEDENILEPPKPPHRGIVKIQVYDENESATDPAAVSENIYRIAQNKMKAGDYRGAIKDFLASLNGSQKPALTHQLIARCYKALGDKENARQHFENAKRLYKQAGQTEEEKACEKELQLLG
ncbi:MAG TPA: tetratricopeptide repeat protein [Fimbriimonadales bacterium]|nr:tetratricopeptide repeat protein [Fimbriimonadales bacterium]